MTTTAPRAPLGSSIDPGVARVARARWWPEVLLALGYYVAYAAIRDLHGAVTGHATAVARAHGWDVLDAERWLHLSIEKGLQSAVLPARPLIVAMDVFYGTAHFLLTVAVFGWLLARAPRPQFRHARNLLAIGTAIGLVGFAIFPTMPPRLMPAGVKTIDTMDAVGGLWSYNHGVIEHISDPYAAMPSLHIVWASWVGYVLWRGLRRRIGRLALLAWAYPVVTGFVVIATGTHWLLDLIGGAAVFAIALAVSRWLDRRRHPDSCSPPDEHLA
jgi:membrane-associated phospholipid phosphatase